mmetsp:Transcript_4715/g.5248  ORF Transcript_4715/g.5248 Transcript_4715/m.5248 type:complete len:249 (+) Transcript_4715:3-749(+)
MINLASRIRHRYNSVFHSQKINKSKVSTTITTTMMQNNNERATASSSTILKPILKKVARPEEENDRDRRNTRIQITGETTENTNNQSKRRKARIQFANIEVRQYNRILGDNPACSYGPPIQLDWTHDNQQTQPTISIDEYESNRLRRRTRRQLSMSTTTRRNMMYFHFGYNHAEIDKAADSIKKIQKHREQTILLSKRAEQLQEVAETIKRRTTRFIGREKVIPVGCSRINRTQRLVCLNHEISLTQI